MPGYEEERIVFDSDGLALEGILAYPSQGHPKVAAVLLSPHPQMGGNMDNNVITHLARKMAQVGAVTLRFNYRGVGGSEIKLAPNEALFDHWAEMEASRDYAELLVDAKKAHYKIGSIAPESIPTIVVGYSLGAVLAGELVSTVDAASVIAIAPPVTRVSLESYRPCAIPKLFIAGDKDFVFDADTFAAEFEQLPSPKEFVLMEGVDHFFRAKEELLFSILESRVAPFRETP